MPQHEEILKLVEKNIVDDDDCCSLSSESTASLSTSSTPSIARSSSSVASFDSEVEEGTSCAPKEKKSVRIDEELNREHENKLYCREESQNSWYTERDYRHFKRQTKTISRAVVQSEACNCAPFSYKRVMKRVFDVCASASTEADAEHSQDGCASGILSEDDMRHMKRWAEAAPMRLGIERFTIRSISRDMALLRGELVETVLALQKVETQPGCAFDRAEHIRRSSMRASRPSRLFARAIAEAQAAALEGDRFFDD